MKLSKYGFYKREVRYLRHIISEKSVAVDRAKVKVILEWTVPKDVHHIRPSMVLTRYYRIFIENFSRIVHPITTLQKKSVIFVWNQ